MSYNNVVNPGLVNVADQGDGLTVVNQTIATGPSTNPGPVVAGLASAPGLGADSPDQPVRVSSSTNPGPLAAGLTAAPGLGADSPDQPVTISPAMTAGSTVQGGTASPSSKNVTTVITNNVVGQVYGTGSPSNVFV